MDSGLSKAFGLPNNGILGDGAKVRLRMDFYNLFNNANLSAINGALGTVWPNSNFCVAKGADGARTIKLQARFRF